MVLVAPLCKSGCSLANWHHEHLDRQGRSEGGFLTRACVIGDVEAIAGHTEIKEHRNPTLAQLSNNNTSKFKENNI